MQSFVLSRDAAQYVVLQRIELASPRLQKIRKTFGRYLFSNIFSKYFISPEEISTNYYKIMDLEYLTIKKFLEANKNILSIGSGMGGLEIIINKKHHGSFFTFIERNFLSKKVIYGWDKQNNEAYNNLEFMNNFLQENNFDTNCYELIDYDNQKLPIKKFDLITSLYSLDYHYNFDLYMNYLKICSKLNTIIIFDTIRPDYFKKIFKIVEIIKEDNNTLHKSKRIACKNFI